VTFLNYAQAHREGRPGGFAPIIIGSLLVGLLVSTCSYFNRSRNTFAAAVSGIISAIAFFSVLLATLISCFGS